MQQATRSRSFLRRNMERSKPLSARSGKSCRVLLSRALIIQQNLSSGSRFHWPIELRVSGKRKQTIVPDQKRKRSGLLSIRRIAKHPDAKRRRAREKEGGTGDRSRFLFSDCQPGCEWRG